MYLLGARLTFSTYLVLHDIFSLQYTMNARLCKSCHVINFKRKFHFQYHTHFLMFARIKQSKYQFLTPCKVFETRVYGEIFVCARFPLISLLSQICVRVVTVTINGLKCGQVRT